MEEELLRIGEVAGKPEQTESGRLSVAGSLPAASQDGLARANGVTQPSGTLAAREVGSVRAVSEGSNRIARLIGKKPPAGAGSGPVHQPGLMKVEKTAKAEGVLRLI
jgi:hypothetical protein